MISHSFVQYILVNDTIHECYRQTDGLSYTVQAYPLADYIIECKSSRRSAVVRRPSESDPSKVQLCRYSSKRGESSMPHLNIGL